MTGLTITSVDDILNNWGVNNNEDKKSLPQMEKNEYETDLSSPSFFGSSRTSIKSTNTIMSNKLNKINNTFNGSSLVRSAYEWANTKI